MTVPPKYRPDFVELARSYGADGMRVEKEEDIEKAFEEAVILDTVGSAVVPTVKL